MHAIIRRARFSTDYCDGVTLIIHYLFNEVMADHAITNYDYFNFLYYLHLLHNKLTTFF